MNKSTSICICGAGTMGSGIAQVFAMTGFQVILYDVSREILEKSRARITNAFNRLLEKRNTTEAAKDKMLSAISFVDDISKCRAPFIIEAVKEDLDVKTLLITQLFHINDVSCIVVSNTSSLAITRIAENVPAPERVAGMHFFNPATVMKLVEVVRTRHTLPSVIDYVVGIAKEIGKTPVVCNDSPGFIVNRVARPYYLEALFALENGWCRQDEIDRLLENTGFPMGPFRLMDLIGNDVNYSVSSIIFEALQKPARLTPSDLQRKMAEQGRLGRKSGKGFYDYSR